MHTGADGISGLHVTFSTLAITDLWRVHRSGWGAVLARSPDACLDHAAPGAPPHSLELCTLLKTVGATPGGPCLSVSMALGADPVAGTMLTVELPGATLVANRDTIAMLLRFVDTSETGGDIAPPPPPPPPPPAAPATPLARLSATQVCVACLRMRFSASWPAVMWHVPVLFARARGMREVVCAP
jgi:hypothetical protein